VHTHQSNTPHIYILHIHLYPPRCDTPTYPLTRTCTLLHKLPHNDTQNFTRFTRGPPYGPAQHGRPRHPPPATWTWYRLSSLAEATRPGRRQQRHGCCYR
jgi:hypothetical protein